MKVIHEKNADGSLIIHLEFTAEEVNCLRHDLDGDLGIVDWYSKGPSQQKILKCKKRMMLEGMKMLRDAGKSVPADDSQLIKDILAEPDYLDREAREKEALKNPA